MTQFRPFRRLILLLLALLLPAATAVAAPPAGEIARFRHTCAAAVAAAERGNAIPDKLLTAISYAESGRWDGSDQATIAWPWTVTAEGTGHFLPSRAAAIAKVKALRARGITNIDVGCMQVNLHYHPDAFADLSDAFDPATNAAYAGKFLAALKRETGSWGAAAARYHSATRAHAAPYRARVMRLWNEARADALRNGATRTTAAAESTRTDTPDADAAARKRAADAYRQAMIAAYLERRAERRSAATQRVATAD